MSSTRTAELDSRRNGSKQNGQHAPRVPPHNMQAEASLLGAMLLAVGAIDAALEVGLSPDDFYKPAHGHVYQTIVALHARGEPADAITVADELRRAGLMDTVGGPAALVALQDATSASSNARRYARIVDEHATLRRLIGVAGEIAEMCYGLPEDVASAADQAEALLHAVTDRRRVVADKLIPIHELLARNLERLEQLYESGNRDGVTGVPSGLQELDQLTGGFHPGQLVVIAARPSVGKSAVGTGIALHAATDNVPPHPALLVSIEMGEEEITQRWLANAARIDTRVLRNGRLAANDWPRLSHAVGRLSDRPLWLSDDPDATVPSIAATARRIPGLALVVVDYLQLMRSAKRVENRQVEVAEMSSGLKRLARDRRIPVVALAQLNRGLEARADKRPQLADLRESGAIENDADVVIGLYRDEVYKPDSPDRGVMELIVLKQRNGPLGTARVAYQPEHNLIANMASPFDGDL